ncbi:MAG: WxcM-like domain-containing protein [bacterium]|nr:WxcM-like domain-containing protein [bacterium]
MKVNKLEIKTDQRGWLAEILRRENLHTGREAFGQFFVTTAHPGITKGHHYHLRKHEWFCVIKGRALLVLEDIDTKQRTEIPMGEDNMVTVELPLKSAHAIKNTGEDMMYLLAYVDEPFNPEDGDTQAYKIDL